MKTALKLSLLANVALGAVVWYRAARPPAAAPAPRAALTEAPNPIADAPASAPAPQLVLTERFDWRQVEAPDYPTYIANLRAIKCPEQTVRDIIMADVANVFALKRKESSNSSVAAGRWVSGGRSELVAALFGDPVGPQLSSAQPADASTGTAEPVRMPLVFQTQALATLKLNDEQREELAELAQQFLQEIGGVNQDPNDPAYRAKWQQAQPKFDALIVSAIGRRALVDLDQAIPPPEGHGQ